VSRKNLDLTSKSMKDAAKYCVDKNALPTIDKIPSVREISDLPLKANITDFTKAIHEVLASVQRIYEQKINKINEENEQKLDFERARANKIKDELTVAHNAAMKKQKDEAEAAFQLERVNFQRMIERLQEQFANTSEGKRQKEEAEREARGEAVDAESTPESEKMPLYSEEADRIVQNLTWNRKDKLEKQLAALQKENRVLRNALVEKQKNKQLFKFDRHAEALKNIHKHAENTGGDDYYITI
jgi:hypothetical protein